MTAVIGLLSIVALGFFLGMRHATDPDHVIAISTIVARHRSIRDAAIIGGLWGVGHTATILAVGSGIILFGWVIPARVGLSMEFSVGLMLILLGILNLTGFLQWISSAFLPQPAAEGEVVAVCESSAPSASLHASDLHEGAQAEFPHAQAHAWGGVHTHDIPRFSDGCAGHSGHASLNWFDRRFGRLGVYHAARPLIVGLVHGLAGSAAVALLVLATIHDARWAVLYLLLFGVGTIAGMMLITAALVIPFAFSNRRFTRLNGSLRVASGLLSFGFGLFVVYETGLVNGLLTAHPHWTPR